MSCRGCIYKAKPHSGYGCNYLLFTGHSRGCPVEVCTKKETKGQARRRRDRPVNLRGSLPPDRRGNRTAHRTREDKPGPQLSFDETKALELYHAGKNDTEIGEAVGATRHCIQKWRVRRGLPGISKGRPKK